MGDSQFIRLIEFAEQAWTFLAGGAETEKDRMSERNRVSVSLSTSPRSRKCRGDFSRLRTARLGPSAYLAGLPCSRPPRGAPRVKS
jgi:hypothetical protein